MDYGGQARAFCPQCGTKRLSDAAFCAACGYSFGEATGRAATAAPMPTEQPTYTPPKAPATPPPKSRRWRMMSNPRTMSGVYAGLPVADIGGVKHNLEFIGGLQWWQ